MLRKVVIDTFPSWSTHLEGRVYTMYPDVKMLITCAIGVLCDASEQVAKGLAKDPIAPALALPWVHADGTPATKQEIADEWKLLKSHSELAHLGYKAAAKYCKLRLTDAAIDAIVMQRFNANYAWVKSHYFKDVDEWPAAAQLATMSMSWAIGAGFPTIYRDFYTLALKHDWLGCADNCHINEKNNAGVVPRNVENIRLLKLAATLKPEQYDLLQPPASEVTTGDGTCVEKKSSFAQTIIDLFTGRKT